MATCFPLSLSVSGASPFHLLAAIVTGLLPVFLFHLLVFICMRIWRGWGGWKWEAPRKQIVGFGASSEEEARAPWV